ncbi:alpha/beta hydrolase family protein [Altererythrobacter sp. CC-YST694]|uniref:alpha/beta hydrolase family protein n=1 Tax=Altererythrobacter sp. CC-YST694 TaxID=2755038 RepID=UPI001D0302E6|nr:S9 family peptidase [Altererythrobacter sp. CC-YST694]
MFKRGKLVRERLLGGLGAAVFLLAAPTFAREAPPLEAYGELPALERVALSASGDKFAVVTTIEGKRLLLIFDSSMKLLRRSEVGDLKLRNLDWIGDEAVLVMTSSTEKLPFGFTANSFESFRAITIPVDRSAEIKMVLTDSKRIINSIFGNYGIRKVEGEWRGYFGGIVLEKGSTGYTLGSTAPSLIEVNLLKNASRKKADPSTDDYWRDWLLDASGNVAARMDMDRSTGEWRLAGPESKTIARGKQQNGRAGLVGLGKDGTTVIFYVEGEEGIDWFELPLTGEGEPAEVFAETNIDRTFFGKNTSSIIGMTIQGTRPEATFFDTEWNERAQKVSRAFAKLDYDILDWNDDFTRVLVRTSGTGDSGSWYIVDIDRLRAEPVGVERPGIAPEDVGPVSVFTYKAQDGLELDGVLTLPPGREAKNLPVIMLPHGGPAGHDRPQFDWWAQAFAARGYAVLQPNFRGSTNRDAAFRRAGNGEWGRKMQTDVSDGLAALVAAGIADPSRACIMGASYGGYAALAGVTLQNGIYRCAVAVAGVSDLKLMYNTEYREGGRSGVLRTSLKEQLGRTADLDIVSPRRFAPNANAPILLVHGKDDTVVAFEQSVKMADALKDAGKPYKFVQLAGEDHWLSRSETRRQMLAEAMAFVEQYNPADRAEPK